MIFKAYYRENLECEGEKIIIGEVMQYDNLTEFLICGDESLTEHLIDLLDDGKIVSKFTLFDYYNNDDEIPTICGEAEDLEIFLKNNFVVLERI